MEGYNIIKRKTQAQVFFCAICKNFENTSFKEHFWATTSIVIAWNTKLLSLSFFLLTFLMFIYWSFSSFGLCFCPTYSVNTMIQMDFDSYTVFTYVCHWKSCHLVFFFESMWRKRKKKQQNSNECFACGLEKIQIPCILIKSVPQCLTQQNLNSPELFCCNWVI